MEKMKNGKDRWRLTIDGTIAEVEEAARNDKLEVYINNKIFQGKISLRNYLETELGK